MYLAMLEKTKTYNRLTKKVIEEHVENLRRLDDEGLLELCGVLQGWPGMAGMYILRTEDKAEAKALCDREPLVAGGNADCKLASLLPDNRDNNYLLRAGRKRTPPNGRGPLIPYLPLQRLRWGAGGKTPPLRGRTRPRRPTGSRGCGAVPPG